MEKIAEWNEDLKWGTSVARKVMKEKLPQKDTLVMEPPYLIVPDPENGFYIRDLYRQKMGWDIMMKIRHFKFEVKASHIKYFTGDIKTQTYPFEIGIRDDERPLASSWWFTTQDPSKPSEERSDVILFVHAPKYDENGKTITDPDAIEIAPYGFLLFGRSLSPVGASFIDKIHQQRASLRYGIHQITTWRKNHKYITEFFFERPYNNFPQECGMFVDMRKDLLNQIFSVLDLRVVKKYHENRIDLYSREFYRGIKYPEVVSR